MRRLFFSLFVFFPLSTQALELRGTPRPTVYECRLLLVAGDVKEGGDWKFFVGKSSDGHGGAPQEFREGAHELVVIANEQWLGLSWQKDGRKIAQTVFVLGAGDQAKNRAAIAYDPSDNGDQVSLGCDLVQQ